MALSLDLTTSNYGVSFTGVYYKIMNTVVSKDRSGVFLVMIDVVGYATKPINDNIKDIDFKRYHTTLEIIESQTGSVFLEKIYNWVATQEDMIGSIKI